MRPRGWETTATRAGTLAEELGRRTMPCAIARSASEGAARRIEKRQALGGERVDKQDILSEIKRTAAENGGTPLGMARFEAATQIRRSDWFGKYWKSWGQAVSEAGLRPNALQLPIDEDEVLQALAELVRELGGFPVEGDLRLKRRRDPAFPSHNVFARLGPRAARIVKALGYCRSHTGFEDVVALLSDVVRPGATDSAPEGAPVAVGYVYLVKHGSRREYKIGRTSNPLRREGEIAVELPERVTPVHVIGTDDPTGVEEYWHRRFADRRKNGEWFELTVEDVRAFKRWRRIV
jgi:hypothetical protein